VERIYYHPDLALYDFGEWHPFRGKRFNDFMSFLEKSGWVKGYDVIEAREASNDELRTVHTENYINFVHYAEEKGNIFLSPDTYVLPGMVRGCKLMVGSAIDGVRFVWEEGGHALAFGGLHHAYPDHGEGFCLFNDVAISAKVAMLSGIKRVLNLDTDAHHGNGTMDIFYDSPQFLYISIHQDPSTLYPGRGFVHEIGRGDGEGYTVNIPLSPGASDGDYMFVLDTIIFPIIDEFKPDICIRNGGTDMYVGDTLTELSMSLEGIYTLGMKIREYMIKNKIPWVDLIASGYGNEIIKSWGFLFAGLFGLDMDDVVRIIDVSQSKRELSPDVLKSTKDTVRLIRKSLGEYWNI